MILDAIQDANIGINELKNDVKGVKADIFNIKSTVDTMQQKLSKVESMYEDRGKRFDTVEGTLKEIRF